MGNLVKISIDPSYIEIAPHIQVAINDHTLFEGQLDTAKVLEHQSHQTKNLNIKILRSGKTKKVADTDRNNGFTIKAMSINGVDVNPDIGRFYADDNAYVSAHVVHSDTFTLNGTYRLEIPFYSLSGEITKHKERYLQTGVENTFTFFGASMTMYDFATGIPPMPEAKNYADLFLENHKGQNLAARGQTNQEVFETVYKFLENNKSSTCFVQLVSSIGRQVKNSKTGEIKRWSAHENNNLEWVDNFTGVQLKSIQEHFVYLDVKAIMSLQIPEYIKITKHAEKCGSKIYFVIHHKEEYEVLKNIIPNNLAPYFNIDITSQYCKDNDYHATYQEHQDYCESLIDFIGKRT